MSTMRNRVAFVVAPAFLLGCASGAPSPQTDRAVALAGRVLVSQIEYNGPPELSHYASGLRDSLTSDLEKIKGIEVISDADQNRALVDLAQRRRAGEEINLTAETARILRSDFLCSGSITAAGKTVRIALRVARAPSFSVVASSSMDGDASRFFEVADRAALLLLNRIDAKLTDAEKSLLITPLTKNAEAADSYFRGLKVHNIQPKQALLFYLKALSLDPDFADGLLRAGQAAEALNLYDRAVKLYRKRLEILEKNGQAVSLPYAVTLNNIGSALDSQGKYAEALELYVKSQVLRKQLGLEESLGYASTLGNIGHAYNQKGDTARALEYFFQALSVQEKVGARDSIGYANTLTNIGTVYRQQQRYEKAIETYERSNGIRDKLKLANTASYAVNLNNMGVAYRALKQPRRALELFQRRLSIYEKLGLENTEGYAITSYNIGDVYFNDLKDPCAAAKSFEVAVTIGTRLKSRDLVQDRKALEVARQECGGRAQ